MAVHLNYSLRQHSTHHLVLQSVFGKRRRKKHTLYHFVLDSDHNGPQISGFEIFQTFESQLEQEIKISAGKHLL